MELVIEEIDAGRDVRVLAVRGEIDLASAPLLSTKLNAAVRAGAGGVVVDLSGAELVDSAGISVLLNALRRMTRARRRLALVCPPGPVLQALGSTRLDTTFVIRPTREEAVAATVPTAPESGVR
jgi:anti-sigma B factor antagonist